MTSRVLRLLAAQHQFTDKDALEFGPRVKSEHYFGSVSEALDAIYACVTDNINSILEDDSPNIRLADNPTLRINIIDEAVCSIAYYIFKAQSIYNVDTIVFYRSMLEEMASKLMKFHNNSDNITKSEKVVITQLHQILYDLSHAAFPNAIDEESVEGQLAINYYCLMFFMYYAALPSEIYFSDIAKFYLKRVNTFKRRHTNE